MKFRSWIYLAVLILVLAPPIRAAHSAPAGWQPVATGIDYQEFTAPGPNDVFVARMDRHNPDVTLDSSLALGEVIGAKETVRGMANRYDQAINAWGGTWGARDRVVVAINGDFFDPYTGVSIQGVVHSGSFDKRFLDNQSGSGFAWKSDRSAFIGECVYNKRSNQYVTRIATGWMQRFDGINAPRGADQFIVYTPQYDSNTHTDNSGVEILVEMTQPAGVIPTPGMAKGVIEAILDGQGSTPIPFDHVVLSANGFPRAKLLDSLQVGDEIGITQEISNCDYLVNPPDWTDTYASIGGSFYFLKNGDIQSFSNGQANVRDPRTAIAYNDNYVFFIVVDGRNPGVSVGMSIGELAGFAKNTLGAFWGIAQDGGGSSTMVVNGKVVNNTTCNFTDCGKQTAPESSVSPAAPGSTPLPPAVPGQQLWDATSGQVEALVANGMMMVVVEPFVQSKTFEQGGSMITLSPYNIRLGPGTNYPVLETTQANSEGIVLANNLNGVLAKGYYWWKVQFGSTSGWIVEQNRPLFSLSIPLVSQFSPATQQRTYLNPLFP